MSYVGHHGFEIDLSRRNIVTEVYKSFLLLHILQIVTGCFQVPRLRCAIRQVSDIRISSAVFVCYCPTPLGPSELSRTVLAFALGLLLG